MLNFQEAIYPANYNKLRCLENHDQPRIRSFVPRECDLINYTAFLYFLKGTTLIYAGQEFENIHLPSLFEKDTVSRGTGRDLSKLMRRLYEIKRDHFGCEDYFLAAGDDKNNIAVLERGSGDKRFIGVFSLRSLSAEVSVDLPDGTYPELISGTAVEVRGGKLRCTGDPIILEARQC